jgi:NitT/TauT family transport system substrate-binding protein
VTDMDYAYPNPAMATSGELIRKKPELIERFMRAYVRGIHHAKNNRESTIKTLAKYSTVTDSVLLTKTYEFYMNKVLERVPYVNMQGMQNAIDDLGRTLSAAKNAKPEQFVDFRFLDRIEKSGLLKELYK